MNQPTHEELAYICKLTRKRVEYDIRHVFNTSFQNFGGACLFYAMYGTELFNKMFPEQEPIVQAGNASWRIVDPEDDDGVMDTHFGFEWGGDPNTAQYLSNHVFDLAMPEVHCWIALRSTEMIVDFSVGDLIYVLPQFKKRWQRKELPPNFIATTFGTSNDHCYKPVTEACIAMSDRMKTYRGIIEDREKILQQLAGTQGHTPSG